LKRESPRAGQPVTTRWQSVYPVSSVLLGVLAFSITLFRVCTQSIAHDEALSYWWHLRDPVSLLTYSATNHVLSTLATEVSIRLLGLGEIPMRLAGLFGAAIYIVFTILLARRLFGLGIILPAATALLCFNPTVMDFLVAARGYGLGLGFLVTSIYFLIGLGESPDSDPHSQRWRRTAAWAGIALALSMASNLTNMIPAACLGLSMFVVALTGGVFPKPTGEALKGLAKYFVLPCGFTFLFITWPYLTQVHRRQLYIGYPSKSEALHDLFNSTFLFRWTDDVFSSSLSAVQSPSHSWPAMISNVGSFIILPLFFVILAVSMVRCVATHKSAATLEKRIVVPSSVLSVIFILGMHKIGGVKYPVTRTCLYVIPLFTISLLLVIRDLPFRSVYRSMGLAVAILAVASYAASSHLKYYRYNAYDETSREMFFHVLSDIKSGGLEKVRIGGTWWYEPEINFYAAKYNARQIGIYEIADSSCDGCPVHSFAGWENVPTAQRSDLNPDRLNPQQYDYFILTPGMKNVPVSTRVVFRSSKDNVTVVAVKR
jgi:hypothetical protein